MTPIDKNPRHFFVDAVAIEANVDADSTRDFVTIEFAGRVPASIKERLTKALAEGEFELIEKRLA